MIENLISSVAVALAVTWAVSTFLDRKFPTKDPLLEHLETCRCDCHTKGWGCHEVCPRAFQDRVRPA